MRPQQGSGIAGATKMPSSRSEEKRAILNASLMAIKPRNELKISSRELKFVSRTFESLNSTFQADEIAFDCVVAKKDLDPEVSTRPTFFFTPRPYVILRTFSS